MNTGLRSSWHMNSKGKETRCPFIDFSLSIVSTTLVSPFSWNSSFSGAIPKSMVVWPSFSFQWFTLCLRAPLYSKVIWAILVMHVRGHHIETWEERRPDDYVMTYEFTLSVWDHLVDKQRHLGRSLYFPVR